MIWWITWLVRICVGATFIISGFVKAIDPWGVLYKFEEYLAALHINMLPSVLLASVFLLCAAEFLMGVFLLLGCYRKSNPVAVTLFMSVMLIITIWVAAANPVADCGCFGDFFILSNRDTLLKNIVLMAMALWLLKFNIRCNTLISPAFQWIAFVVSFIFVSLVEFWGYNVQPLLDFRSYPEGDTVLDYNHSADDIDDEKFIFVYEKDGIKKEFGEEDELPDEDDGWKFIESKSVKSESNKNSQAFDSGKSLRLYSMDGTEDYTEEALPAEGKIILLLMPDLMDVSPADTWKLNAIRDKGENLGVTTIAAVGVGKDEIAAWEDIAMPQYPIYMADDTAIKEVARGNPAVVYIESGKVKWKSTLNALDAENFEPTSNLTDFSTLRFNSSKILKTLISAYILSIAFLIIISCLPRLVDLIKRRNTKENTLAANDETSRTD